MATPEITIYGAGIFGLSIAFEILKRGQTVEIIEINKPGFGSSGGVLGALAPHTPDNWNEKKQFQFESLIKQDNFWNEVKSIGGKDAQYCRFGRISPLLDERAIQLSAERTANAKSLWKGLASWETLDKLDKNWEIPSPTGLYSFDTLSAQLNPKKACDALLSAVKAMGANITIDPKYESKNDNLEVWATGYYGLQKLSGDLEKSIGDGVKGQAALLALDRKNYPQLFVDGIHIIPQENNSVAIGSTSEITWQHENTDEKLDRMIEKIKKICPALSNSNVINVWSGIRPRAKGRSPLIGPHPNKKNVFIANGGFKIGIGLAPKIAEITADFLLENINHIPKKFTPNYLLSIK